jgi:hypothetical protein
LTPDRPLEIGPSQSESFWLSSVKGLIKRGGNRVKRRSIGSSAILPSLERQTSAVYR